MKLWHISFAVLAFFPGGVQAQDGAKEKKQAETVECVGHTVAGMKVVIVPRVTGFIVSTFFKEGDAVKKGDVLFKIDPRPYQAQFKAVESQLKAAESELAVHEAKLRYDTATNHRFRDLARQNPKAVSERELDQYQALEEQSRANLELAKAKLIIARANLELPAINLAWTTVTAPIDGRAGRIFLAPGNLAKQDTSQLTTIESLESFVRFEVDERTFLRIQRKLARPGATIKVRMGLADEEGHPHEGSIASVDPQFDAKTGTGSVRAVFANPGGEGGRLLHLATGLSVRVRFTLDEAK